MHLQAAGWLSLRSICRRKESQDPGCRLRNRIFTILLAKEGHQVTGIDLTPDMITHAKELAEEEKANCRFMVMDAEAPDFPDEEFDVIVSRNLTWTLPDAGVLIRNGSAY